jgi:hypothetical protein
MEVNGQLHVPAALSQGKSPWYPTDRRLGGPYEPECKKIKSSAVKTQLYGLTYLLAISVIFF